MKKIVNNISMILLISISLIKMGCSDLSKINTDLDHKIEFSRSFDQETGEPIGIDSSFTIMDGGRIFTFLDLDGYFEKAKKKELMLHWEWINPVGYTFYQKREDIVRDSTNLAVSSISITPEFRKEGDYKLRIYFFRELIGEKTFHLFPKFKLEDYNLSTKKIDLSTKMGKKNESFDQDISEITIMNKKWIRTNMDVKPYADLFHDRELLFKFHWLDSENKTIYSKRVNLNSNDSIPLLKSSMSISPGERSAGDYTVKLYLFDELLAVNYFKLLPPLEVKKIDCYITFCRKIGKKTGKRYGISTVFNRGKKNKVTACLDLKNCLAFGKRDLDFKIVWRDSKGKRIYSKQISFLPNSNSIFLKSVISVSPSKRKKGKYKLQVYLFNELISEKSFYLEDSK